MTLSVDQNWLTEAVLLWLRLGALLFMTPLLSGFNGPSAVTLLLSLVLAGLFCAGAPVHATTLPSSALQFMWAGVLEVGLGMLLGFGVHAAFAVFGMAGSLLDLQIGFGSGNVFDPVTRANSPVLGAIFNSLAVVLFFTLDAHHAFMRGIAFSVSEIPPGSMTMAFSLEPVVRQFGAIFSLAVAMAAPVLFTLLLLEAGLAVVSRMLPQMNVYFVGLPLKILVGLTALSIASASMAPVMVRAFASIFQFWDQVLR